MMRFKKPIAIGFVVLVLGCASLEEQVGLRESSAIRVACVGDSITYGSGIEQRNRYSYPARLGRLLGSDWEVRNFGVSGATLQKRGDLPYWNQGAFDHVLEFDPDVIIIQLGTNDTKPHNWDHEAFTADYLALVELFSSLPSRPRIFLCKPVPAFSNRFGIQDALIHNEVANVVASVARDAELPVIDLYAALEGKAGLFPDEIHPNEEGATVMAATVALSVLSDTGRRSTPKD